MSRIERNYFQQKCARCLDARREHRHGRCSYGDCECKEFVEFVAQEKKVEAKA